VARGTLAEHETALRACSILLPRRGNAAPAVLDRPSNIDADLTEHMMKKRIAALSIAAVLMACQDASDPTSLGPNLPQEPSPLIAAGAQGAAEQVVPGQVLTRLRDGVAAEDVAGPIGLTVAGRGHGNAFVILRGAVGNERALAARLRDDARVVWAEPDYLRQPTVDPRLWAFHNPGNLTITFTRGASKGQVVSSLRSKADADEDAGGSDVTAGYGAGGGVVTIGSIDTGVEFGHAEFSGVTLIAGHDWYSNDANPADDNGHGTHTTGTMVGNTMGVAAAAGASGKVRVYVQRVCGAQGCPSSATASAIRAAADFGVVAMNLSLGGSSESQAEKDAITYALGKNALVIASAGNGGTGTVSCPACDPNAIAVAASDWLDEHAYYTNWGSGLDIIAPGGELYSNTTEEAGILSAYLGGGYAYLQGTSMAAPQVTGTAGVVASKIGATGAALRARLLGTTNDLGAGGYDTNFGCGRLNTYQAVTAGGLSGCEDPTAGGGGGGGGLSASFSYSCGGSAACSFDGSASSGATTWNWNFGDGATASGITTSHTYAGAGTFTVTLEVGDGSSTSSASRTVQCRTRGPRLRCS
jgi:serine protease